VRLAIVVSLAFASTAAGGAVGALAAFRGRASGPSASARQFIANVPTEVGPPLTHQPDFGQARTPFMAKPPATAMPETSPAANPER
jgi:hypothetical protein